MWQEPDGEPRGQQLVGAYTTVKKANLAIIKCLRYFKSLVGSKDDDPDVLPEIYKDLKKIITSCKKSKKNDENGCYNVKNINEDLQAYAMGEGESEHEQPGIEMGLRAKKKKLSELKEEVKLILDAKPRPRA